MIPALREGDRVAYQHPDWGHVVGVVLDERVEAGRVLVLDMSPNGARERWPAGELRVLDVEEDEPGAEGGTVTVSGSSVTLRGPASSEPCVWCGGSGRDKVEDEVCFSCGGDGRARGFIPVAQVLALAGRSA